MRTVRLASLSPHSRPAAWTDLNAEPRQLLAEFDELPDAFRERLELRRRVAAATLVLHSLMICADLIVECEQAARHISSRFGASSDM